MVSLVQVSQYTVIFGLKFNDNTCCEVICKRRYNDNDIMTTNKLPGMYFFNYRYIPHTKSV